MTTVTRIPTIFFMVDIFCLVLVCGKSHQDFNDALDSHYRTNFVKDSQVKEKKYTSDLSLKESEKVVSDSIRNNSASYTKDKNADIWLKYELPFSQPFTDGYHKKISRNKAFVDRSENYSRLKPKSTLSSDTNTKASHRRKTDATQTGSLRENQASSIILKLIDLLDLALGRRKTRKFRNRLDFEQYPNINFGSNVSIDTVSAVQELMLKFLEWGAFVATDLLFQLVWPG